MDKKNKILIADDDQKIRYLLREILEDHGYLAIEAGDGYQALEEMKDPSIDLVLLDLKMPGMDGLQVLKKTQASTTNPVIIVVTAHGTIKTAIEATRLGAYDFIEKPIEEERILHIIEKALKSKHLERENTELKNVLCTGFKLIGNSPETINLRKFIESTAKIDTTVLITGNNGTGKDLVARNIHLHSARAGKPFVNINCAAIPENLIESELFGFEKGAFTGADRRQIGKFEYASGGTILLNEIGEMSPHTQAKLLHVLENRSFSRLGNNDDINVDVRVIAATNRNLSEAMEDGSFRTDLYYRLQIINFRIADLKDRQDDIILLFEHFMAQFCQQHGLAMKKLAPESVSPLLNYDWPGNIRQLKNVAANLAIVVAGQVITPGILNDALPLHHKPESLSIAAKDNQTLHTARSQFEKEYISKILEEHSWNVRDAADTLNIERTHLYKLLKKLNITRT